MIIKSHAHRRTFTPDDGGSATPSGMEGMRAVFDSAATEAGQRSDAQPAPAPAPQATQTAQTPTQSVSEPAPDTTVAPTADAGQPAPAEPTQPATDSDLFAYLNEHQPDHVKRIQATYEQRDNFRFEAENARQELAQAHERFQALDSRVAVARDAGMDDAAIDDLMAFGRTLRADPMAAFQTIENLYRHYGKIVGAVLPDDLQGQVANGFITEAEAQQQARVRGQHQAMQHKMEFERKQLEAQQQRMTSEQQARQLQSLEIALDNWGQGITASDPSFQQLKPDFERELSFLVINEKKREPESVQEVHQWAQEAWTNVKARHPGHRPAPQPGHIPPQHTGGPPGTAPAQSARGAFDTALAALGK
ncbi:MAG: hypothetical protein MJH10_09345 [Epibacterium sp.]|nr:hypothetical protein [Epibacterium sp.]NQX73740.1 hypothetical protein [Epibacterium sp.]